MKIKNMFIILIITHFSHIVFVMSTKLIFESQYELLYRYIYADICVFISFMVFLFVFVVKKYLDSTLSKYRFYNIFAVFISNIAFIFAWFSEFVLIISFYCLYYFALDCRNNPEICFYLPIQAHIAYLLSNISMSLMLIIAVYFVFSNKILSRNNCLWLFLFSCLTFIIIFRYLNSNALSCFD